VGSHPIQPPPPPKCAYNIHGDISTGGFFAPALTGSQKLDGQWAVGGRAGYLVLPQLLTYVSGGYTQAHWTSTTLASFFAPGGVATLPGSTKDGWFIGEGEKPAEMSRRAISANAFTVLRGSAF
jgi:outer membrane immunogenic protein